MSTEPNTLSFDQSLVEHTKRLLEQAAQTKGLTTTPSIIVGLSGGPDSVFLLHLLAALKEQGAITLHAAHLDHQWRAESGKDVVFCQKLCDNLGIPLTIGKASELSLTVKYNGSKEDVGRRLRRFFFKHVVAKQQADFVALAHHLQDQQETFFIRLLRGSTLNGLRCMDDIDGMYLRPLLHTSKETIVTTLENGKQLYLHDYTNEHDTFLRNRIRKYVLPALTSCDERFDQKFESTLRHLQEEDDFLTRLTQQIFATVFVADAALGYHRGSLKVFRALDYVLQKRLVLLWLITDKAPFSPSQHFIEQIVHFLSLPEGKTHEIRHDLTLHKKQDAFWLSVSVPSK